MKKVLFFVFIMVLVLGSTTFAKGGDPLKFYEANLVHRYDLDGDGKLDIINFACDGVNTPVLYINQTIIPFEQNIPELFLAKFKIVDIDKSDQYSEIAVSFAVPPYENYIIFYRYTPSSGLYVGDMAGELKDFGNNIAINGDGTIINTIHSDLVQGASYQIHYGLNGQELIQTSRDDIYYYQKRLQKTLPAGINFYKSINSKTSLSFDDDVDATFLGELDGWIWVDVEGDVYWLNGDEYLLNPQKTTLKSYEDVYLEEGLLGSIDYFNDNYVQINLDDREKFATQICEEVVKRSREYLAVSQISAKPIPAPQTLEYVNSLYRDIYDGETNTLSLSALDQELQAIIGKIAKDDVFQMVKKYYVMEDVFEDSGFTVAIHPDVFKKLKKVFDEVLLNEFDMYSNQYGVPLESLSLIGKPEELVKASDTSWNTDVVYPEVYVETIDNLQLLKGAWKTNVYLPVNITGTQQTSQLSQLKTYEQIFDQEGLLGSIDYFDKNYDLLDPEARKEFASQISWEVNKRANVYGAINYIERAATPAPPTLRNVNYLYPGIYDGELNILRLNKLDSHTKEVVRKITQDKVFMVTKVYYIVEDMIEDAGFNLTIHPEIFSKLKRALDLTFDKEYDTYVDQYGHEVLGILEIATPDEIVKVTDKSWDSNAKYPKVFVEAIDQLELLKGAWKTYAYIPVNIEDQ